MASQGEMRKAYIRGNLYFNVSFLLLADYVIFGRTSFGMARLKKI